MTEVELDRIVEKILALRELTRTSGTITTHSQNTILRALPDDVLTEVAVRLKKRGEAVPRG